LALVPTSLKGSGS